MASINIKTKSQSSLWEFSEEKTKQNNIKLVSNVKGKETIFFG